MSSGIRKNGSAIIAVAAIVYLIPAFASAQNVSPAPAPGLSRKSFSISSRRCCRPWRHCRAKKPFTVKCARCSTPPPRTRRSNRR